MKVVVFGASGTIGRPLLTELARGHDVVAVSRREQRDSGGVAWKVADATDRAAVAGALEGADVAYYLVHSLELRLRGEDLRPPRPPRARSTRRSSSRLVTLGGPRRRLGRPVRAPAQPTRDGTAAGLDVGSGDDAARGDGRRPRQCRVDDRRTRRPSRLRARRRMPRLRGRNPSRSRTSSHISPACAGSSLRSARLRRRRPGGDDLPRDDRADRPPAGGGTPSSSRYPC